MTYLHLRPLRLSVAHRRVARQELTKALQNQKLEDVIAKRVSSFYEAEANDTDPLRRRMLTNFSQAYTRTELEEAVHSHFEMLLRQ